MSDKKKSFILYLDTLEIAKKLTDEQAGKLLKAFLSYHSEQDFKLDPTLDLVFFSFQAQFERDALKYKKIVERNKINGSKGGRPTKAKKPSGLSGNPTKPKKADSVNGSDSVSDKDSDSGNKKEVTNDRFAEFWNLYGKKTDSSKCKAKFSRLTKIEIELLFEKLPAYINSTPDKQYRKNPITWLNGKCWNDEIIQDNYNKPTHSFENQNYQSGKF